MSGRTSRISALCLIGLVLLPSAGSFAEDAPLTLADLDAYRVALAKPPDPTAPLVTFRDLWDRPETYLGRSIRVEGRLARLFGQPRLGEFPPLFEAWVVSTAGDPFCLVFPRGEGGATLEVGASVRFSGTFVKRIRYRGGDVARVAPLLVGPEPPSTPTRFPEAEATSWSSIEWTLGIGAALVVALVLARRHFARPASLEPVIGPAPIFADGGDVLDSSEEEEIDEGH